VKHSGQLGLVGVPKYKWALEATVAGANEWVFVLNGGHQETHSAGRREPQPVCLDRDVTIARRMVSLSAADGSVASVTLVVRMVNERLRAARWKALSRELEEVALNVDGVRPEMVIATLRSAYRWRDRLSGWSVLLRVARVDFAKRGLPADRLLRGLA
jgi:hypothetical protein